MLLTATPLTSTTIYLVNCHIRGILYVHNFTETDNTGAFFLDLSNGELNESLYVPAFEARKRQCDYKVWLVTMDGVIIKYELCELGWRYNVIKPNTAPGGHLLQLATSCLGETGEN